MSLFSKLLGRPSQAETPAAAEQSARQFQMPPQLPTLQQVVAAAEARQQQQETEKPVAAGS